MSTEKTPAVTRTATKVSPNLKAADSSLIVAKDLANFIKDNKLSSNIQGKEYVQVEGWQFAGSRPGIIPKMGPVTDLSTGTEIRYRAEVTLYDLHNKIELGGGVAECSNKERTKKFYEAYAICSMAQTRAVGKAYRNILAWLIKAAGFEATPYEEMVDVVEAGTSATVVEEKPKALPAQSVQPMHAVPNGPDYDKQAEPVKLQAEATPPASAIPTQPAAPAASTDVESLRSKIEDLPNNASIMAHERTQMIPQVDKMDHDRATQVIAKLEKAIADRKDPQVAMQHARAALVAYANKNAAALGEMEHKRMTSRAEAKTATVTDLSKEIIDAMNWLEQDVAA